MAEPVESHFLWRPHDKLMKRKGGQAPEGEDRMPLSRPSMGPTRKYRRI
jgi:hypothetical protein